MLKTIASPHQGRTCMHDVAHPRAQAQGQRGRPLWRPCTCARASMGPCVTSALTWQGKALPFKGCCCLQVEAAVRRWHEARQQNATAGHTAFRSLHSLEHRTSHHVQGAGATRRCGLMYCSTRTWVPVTVADAWMLPLGRMI